MMEDSRLEKLMGSGSPFTSIEGKKFRVTKVAGAGVLIGVLDTWKEEGWNPEWIFMESGTLSHQTTFTVIAKRGRKEKKDVGTE